MAAEEALYCAIESLSEADARRETELIGKIHQNGLFFQAAAETGEATINWDCFFAHKLPISSPTICVRFTAFSTLMFRRRLLTRGVRRCDREGAAERSRRKRFI
jgi:hypothetical protein